MVELDRLEPRPPVVLLLRVHSKNEITCSPHVNALGSLQETAYCGANGSSVLPGKQWPFASPHRVCVYCALPSATDCVVSPHAAMACARVSVAAVVRVSADRGVHGRVERSSVARAGDLGGLSVLGCRAREKEERDEPDTAPSAASHTSILGSSPRQRNPPDASRRRPKATDPFGRRKGASLRAPHEPTRGASVLQSVRHRRTEHSAPPPPHPDSRRVLA